ncbi:MAG: c-type cytochrome [Halioglobus sp.]
MNKPAKVLRGVVLWVLLPASALADPQALYQTCATCHGAAAEGNPALQAPALAGQDAGYLERQLLHFKAGVRGADPADQPGGQMLAMSTTLAEADIPALADYLAALPPPAVTPAADADLRNGSNYYHSSCGACHGGKAEGNPALHAPALAWLDAAYLERQFRNFQQGLRGTHPEDKYGRQMKMMTTALPDDKTLTDVIAFMQSLAPQAE